MKIDWLESKSKSWLWKDAGIVTALSTRHPDSSLVNLRVLEKSMASGFLSVLT